MAFETTIPCRGIVGWLLGHKFEARYDVHEVVQQKPDPLRDYMAFQTFQKATAVIPPDVFDRKYKGDVCARCGQTINKPILND